MRLTWPTEPTWARVRSAAALLLANRIPLLLLVWWGMLLVTSTPHDCGPQVPACPREAPHNAFLDGWFRWDAHFYTRIARVGYTNVPDDHLHRDTNFWPLFPLLTRIVAYVTPGQSVVIGAFVLNAGLLFGAALLMNDLAERTIGKSAAPLATSLLLSYPFAFYYSAGYTECAFLFFALLTFHCGQRGQWLPAGLASACAGATRMAALAVPVALAVLYLEECGWSLKKVRPNVVWVVVGALGPVAYAAFLQVKFHDPLAFLGWMSAGKNWGSDVTFARFVDTMGALLDPRQWPLSWFRANDAFHAVCLIVASLLTLLGARRLRPHLTVFSAVDLVMISRLWTASGRYCAPLFPTYLVAATLLERRPNAKLLVTTMCLLFMALYAFMYSHGYWVS